MEVITSHIQADFDSFASMIAAHMLYPNAVIVFPGAQEKSLRHYLSDAPPEMTKDIIKIKNISMDDITRLIIVDTKQASRIGDFSHIIGKKGIEIIIFDHHPPSPDDIKGDQEHCRELGSNMAIMVSIVKDRGLSPSPEQATIMALGIFEDTGSLLFPSTTPEDCIALSELIKWGADLNVVAHAISRELNPDQVDILDQLIKNVSILHVGGIDILFTRSVSTRYVEDFAMLVHKLRGMFSVDAIFALGLMGERIYMVARSTLPQINASQIASFFGGGGHPTAAAASIKTDSLDHVESSLINIVKKEARPRITAKDIMTFPVISLDLNATVNEASSTLNRYNINAATIQTKTGRVKGIITRQVVSRAQGHNLGDAKVKDYMIRDIKLVKPEAPVWEIRSLVIDGNQRLLPVEEGVKVIGVITRTDLMRIMHEKMTRVEGITERTSQTKNVTNLMEERLPGDLLELLEQAGSHAASMGFNIYLVGGIVRDMLMRIDNYDIDLVVEGDGIAFSKTFTSSIGARVATHEKYKSAVITLAGNKRIDVATARLEYYKHPGGFPVVEQSTLKLDLYRRDFTINTMAISLNPSRFGELIDFFGAIRDLKEKRLRVLHSLSFVEDPSRILRAVRFEKRFRFTLGKQTTSLVHAAAKSGLLRNIPTKRISHEIKQLLSEDDPIVCMERLRDLGILTAINPEIVFNPSIKDGFNQIKETISWFNLLYTGESYRPWFIYLLSLIENMKPKKIVSSCKSLGLMDDTPHSLLKSRTKANWMLKELVKGQPCPPSCIAAILETGTLEEILYAMSKTKGTDIKAAISTYITTLRFYKPPLTGKDLLEIGFIKGKFLGDCLRLIRDKGLNGEIRDFNEAITFAQDILKKGIKP